MTHFTTRLAARASTDLARLTVRLERVTEGSRLGRRDRGDVPGWVLITVMTAGLVTALWLLAGPALNAMFTSALGKVKGP